MNESDDRAVAQRVRVMQIIAAALLLGLVGFLAFVCFQVFGRQDEEAAPAQGTPILTIVAFALLAACAGLSFLVLTLQTQNALRQIAAGTWHIPEGVDPTVFEGDTAKLLATRQTSMIIGLALLEGPAFMGCVAFMVEARPYALAVVALAIVGMLLRFPTEGGVRAWLSQQQERLNGMRSGGSPGSGA